MRPNRIRELFAAKTCATMGWIALNSTYSAELMGHAGFDTVVVDLQHGPLYLDAAVPLLQALSSTPAMPMARCSDNNFFEINKLLDAGAYGIICPMVNSAEEAARFVSYLRYPPLGQRSFGPTRVSFAAGANYAGEANDNILGFAMIETAEGMANLDAIAATPGLDGIYVGPADLTLSLHQGRLPPGFDREEPEMIAALQTIVAACKKNGLRAALHCGTPDYAAKAIGWGFDMTTVGGDARFLAAAAGAAVAGFRKLTDGASTKAEKGAY